MRLKYLKFILLSYTLMMLTGYAFIGTFFVKCFIGLLPMLGLFSYALIQRKVIYIWFTMACCLGNWLVWGLATFMIPYSMENHISLIYPETWPLRGTLGCFLITGICLGSFLVISMIEKSKLRLSFVKENLSKKPPYSVSVLFFLLVITNIIILFLQGQLLDRTGRTRVLEVSSLTYVISGFNYLFFCFFCILGMRTHPKARTFQIFLRTFLCVLLLSPFFLGGGREAGIMAGLFYLMGLYFSKNGTKHIIRAGTFILPALLLIFVITGILRSNFSEQTFSERLTSIVSLKDETAGDLFSTEVFGGPWGRLSESIAHVVIERTYHTGTYAGFESFNRFYKDILPRFMNSAKSTELYGPKILGEQYDVIYTEETSAPLPTVAAAYRRWGKTGIFITGLFIGFALTLWNLMILRIKIAWIQNLILSVMTYTCLRIYTTEVVALGNKLLYQNFRTFITIWVFSHLLYWLHKNFFVQHRSRN